MLKEIYCRSKDEPLYTNQKMEHSDVLEALVSQIKMILFTRQQDVLGQPGFGVNLEELLFDFGLDANALQHRILDQIRSYVPNLANFQIDVQVNFVPGTVRDAAFIDIYIDGTRQFGVLAK